MDKLNCVLLVDDDKVSNFISERVIKKLDLCNNVRVSNNGEEALLYLTKYCCSFEENHFPELIILDNHMPEMNGIEFLETIKEINISSNHKMKIVVLTGTDNPEEKEKILKLGIEKIYSKPLTEEKLMEIVQDYQVI